MKIVLDTNCLVNVIMPGSYNNDIWQAFRATNIPHIPLTYTRDAATCPTFSDRTAEAVGAIGRAEITPNRP